jgi:TusA-related sulfurtransferase
MSNMTLKDNLEKMNPGEFILVTAENCMCESWDGLNHTIEEKTWKFLKKSGDTIETTFYVLRIA